TGHVVPRVSGCDGVSRPLIGCLARRLSAATEGGKTPTTPVAASPPSNGANAASRQWRGGHDSDTHDLARPSARGGADGGPLAPDVTTRSAILATPGPFGQDGWTSNRGRSRTRHRGRRTCRDTQGGRRRTGGTGRVARPRVARAVGLGLAAALALPFQVAIP